MSKAIEILERKLNDSDYEENVIDELTKKKKRIPKSIEILERKLNISEGVYPRNQEFSDPYNSVLSQGNPDEGTEVEIPRLKDFGGDAYLLMKSNEALREREKKKQQWIQEGQIRAEQNPYSSAFGAGGVNLLYGTNEAIDLVGKDKSERNFDPELNDRDRVLAWSKGVMAGSGKESFGKQVIRSFLASAPSTILAMGTGGGSLILTGLSSAGVKADDLENRTDISEDQKDLSALATGTFEAASEYLGTIRSMKLTKSFFQKVGIDQAKDAMKKELQKSIIGKVSGRILSNIGEEGTEELFNSLATDIVDNAIGVQNKSTKDIVSDALKSGAVGALSASIMTVPSATTSGIIEGLDKGRFETVKAGILDAVDKYNSGDSVEKQYGERMIGEFLESKNALVNTLNNKQKAELREVVQHMIKGTDLFTIIEPDAEVIDNQNLKIEDELKDLFEPETDDIEIVSQPTKNEIIQERINRIKLKVAQDPEGSLTEIELLEDELKDSELTDQEKYVLENQKDSLIDLVINELDDKDHQEKISKLKKDYSFALDEHKKQTLAKEIVDLQNLSELKRNNNKIIQETNNPEYFEKKLIQMNKSDVKNQIDDLQIRKNRIERTIQKTKSERKIAEYRNKLVEIENSIHELKSELKSSGKKKTSEIRMTPEMEIDKENLFDHVTATANKFVNKEINNEDISDKDLVIYKKHRHLILKNIEKTGKYKMLNEHPITDDEAKELLGFAQDDFEKKDYYEARKKIMMLDLMLAHNNPNVDPELKSTLINASKNLNSLISQKESDYKSREKKKQKPEVKKEEDFKPDYESANKSLDVFENLIPETIIKKKSRHNGKLDIMLNDNRKINIDATKQEIKISGSNDKALGKVTQTGINQIVEIVNNLNDDNKTAFHEAYHLIENLFLTEKQKNLIDSGLDINPAMDEISKEEIRAEAFACYMIEKEIDFEWKVKSVFNFLLRKLQNLIKKLRPNDARNIFSNIKNQKIDYVIKTNPQGKVNFFRTPFSDDNSRVYLMTSLANLKGNPFYIKAKNGDPKSAVKLIEIVITKEKMKKLLPIFKSVKDDKIIIIAFNFGLESEGKNKIPEKMADEVSQYFKATTQPLYQKEKVYHTGMKSTLERMLNTPLFEGEVIKGATYVIVDDVVSSGNTLASMKGHIEHNGGKVKGIITLAKGQNPYATNLKPDTDDIAKIKQIYKEKLDEVLKMIDDDLNLSNIEGLTNAEAKQLVSKSKEILKELNQRKSNEDTINRTGNVESENRLRSLNDVEQRDKENLRGKGNSIQDHSNDGSSGRILDNSISETERTKTNYRRNVGNSNRNRQKESGDFVNGRSEDGNNTQTRDERSLPGNRSEFLGNRSGNKNLSDHDERSSEKVKKTRNDHRKDDQESSGTRQNVFRNYSSLKPDKISDIELLKLLREDANNIPEEKEFSKESWLNEFGENLNIETPIGAIKMSGTHYHKLQHNNKGKFFPLFKPTLTNPTIILKDRFGGYSFIKSYKTGNRIAYVMINHKNNDIEPVISEISNSLDLMNRINNSKEVLFIETDQIMEIPEENQTQTNTRELLENDEKYKEYKNKKQMEKSQEEENKEYRKRTGLDNLENYKSKKALKKFYKALNYYKKETYKHTILNYLIQPVSVTLRKISPKLADIMYKYEHITTQNTYNDTHRIVPFLNKLKEIQKIDFDDYVAFDIALKNSNIYEIDHYVKKYKLEKEIAEVRSVLNELYRKAREVKYELGYKENYFPRKFRDPDAFIAFINEVGNIELPLGKIQKAIKLASDKAGRDLNEHEIMLIIKEMIINNNNEKVNFGKISNYLNRSIPEVSLEINRFYESTESAICKYIHYANHQIELRRLFGITEDSLINQQSDNIIELVDGLRVDSILNNNDMIGGLADTLMKNYAISQEHEGLLIDVLNARFNYKFPHKTIQTMRDLGYLTTMANFKSALSQIADIAWAFSESARYTPGEIVKRFIRKETIKSQDLGVDQIAYEFSDGKLLGKFLNKMFNWTGLSKLDNLTKDVLINTVLSKYSNKARNNTLSEIEIAEFKRIYGDEYDSFIHDLKNKVTSDNVKLFLFTKLCQYQPVSLLEMPLAYLKTPNGRLFYMLKSFTIKQFSVLWNEKYTRIMEKGITSKERAKRISELMWTVACLLGCNIGVDWLKDLLFGREFDLPDAVVDSILRLFLVSKYSFYVFKQEGPIEMLQKMVIPPFDYIQYPLMDAFNDLMVIWQKMFDENPDEFISRFDLETLQMMPIVGKSYYWWFGNGHEKVMRTIDKKSNYFKYDNQSQVKAQRRIDAFKHRYHYEPTIFDEADEIIEEIEYVEE